MVLLKVVEIGHPSLRHEEAIRQILDRLELKRLLCCKFNYAMSLRNRRHWNPFISMRPRQMIDPIFEVVKVDGWRIRNSVAEDSQAGNS